MSGKQQILRILRQAALLLPVTVLAACDDEALAPDRPTDRSSEVEFVRSVTGLVVGQSAMEDGLARIARQIALAIADPAVRRQVYAELKASPFRENKLHLRTLLSSNSVELLNGMARFDLLSEGAVFAATDSLVDTEFYMPVKEHFAAWKGDENVIVASYPNDDGSIPRGFDLRGNEIALSAETPPDVPTFVITPAETDFSAAAQERGQDIGSAIPNMEAARTLAGYADSAWIMKAAVIYDDHEGWGAGDPEFEVHAFIEQPSAIYNDVICSGSGMPNPYKWDMNDMSWTGEVMLATQALIGEGNVQFQMWEDDSGPCKDGSGNGKPPKTSDPKISDLTNWGSAVIDIWQASGGINKVEAAIKAIGATYNLVSSANKDDFVGIMAIPVAGCWVDADGQATATIKPSADGQPSGYGQIDVTYGDRLPRCALAVHISGPEIIYDCRDGSYYPGTRYNASVSGGSGSTTYKWYEEGVLSGTSASYTLSDLRTGIKHHVRLVVKRGSETGWDELDAEIVTGEGTPHCR